jgi:hypothetical protein
MFAAPSCTICVIAAASLRVLKKSCHNALLKQQQLQRNLRQLALQGPLLKNRQGFRQGGFFTPLFSRGVGCEN